MINSRNNAVDFVSVVIRPVNDACNLACTYCSSAKYEDSEPGKVIPLTLIDEIMRQASRSTAKYTRFTWHGGEPLLAGKAFYENVRRIQNMYFGAIFDHIIYENVIQTNGLLLKGAFAEYLDKERFTVAFSLDGPDAECNSLRFPLLQANNLIEKSIEAFLNWKHRGKRLAVICVVHYKNAERAEDVYRFFRDIGVDVVSFTPCFRPAKDPHNIDPDLYVRFVQKIYEFREADAMRGERVMSLGVIDNLAKAARGDKCSLCFVSGTCSSFISINSHGELFASCRDDLGVRIGTVAKDGLIIAVDEINDGPRQRIKDILGGHGGKMAVGCPKYSLGNGDIFTNAVIDGFI
jgi:uncharacterized protein